MNKKYSSLFIVVVTAIYVILILNFNNGEYIKQGFKDISISVFDSIGTGLKQGSLKIKTAVGNTANNIRNVLKADIERSRRSTDVAGKNEISVFNSQSNKSLAITNYDLEKIKNASKGLSSMDQAKIESLLRNGNSNEIKSALELIKTRVSDKNFNSLKDILEKLNSKQ